MVQINLIIATLVFFTIAALTSFLAISFLNKESFRKKLSKKNVILIVADDLGTQTTGPVYFPK